VTYFCLIELFTEFLYSSIIVLLLKKYIDKLQSLAYNNVNEILIIETFGVVALAA
jgi:hypothetical protein